MLHLVLGSCSGINYHLFCRLLIEEKYQKQRVEQKMVCFKWKDWKSESLDVWVLFELDQLSHIIIR